MSANEKKCEHEETVTEVTKSAVYRTCKKCKKRLGKLDRVVIEKVIVPKTVPKTVKRF